MGTPTTTNVNPQKPDKDTSFFQKNIAEILTTPMSQDGTRIVLQKKDTPNFSNKNSNENNDEELKFLEDCLEELKLPMSSNKTAQEVYSWLEDWAERWEWNLFLLLLYYTYQDTKINQPPKIPDFQRLVQAIYDYKTNEKISEQSMDIIAELAEKYDLLSEFMIR
jgi:hypothetical protein